MEVLNVGRTAVWRTRAAPSADDEHQSRDDSTCSKKNLLKPWRKLMRCMDELALYARPYDE